MASFGTEFHATLDELAALVEGWVDQHPIVLSAFAFPVWDNERRVAFLWQEVIARMQH